MDAAVPPALDERSDDVRGGVEAPVERLQDDPLVAPGGLEDFDRLVAVCGERLLQ